MLESRINPTPPLQSNVTDLSSNAIKSTLICNQRKKRLNMQF